MKGATNELANLISSLNLRSEEMPIEKHVPLVGWEIVDAKIQHGQVGGFGMGQRSPYGFRRF